MSNSDSNNGWAILFVTILTFGFFLLFKKHWDRYAPAEKKNFAKKVFTVIFIISFLFTGALTIFAAIVTDPQLNNLLSILDKWMPLVYIIFAIMLVIGVLFTKALNFKIK